MRRQPTLLALAAALLTACGGGGGDGGDDSGGGGGGGGGAGVDSRVAVQLNSGVAIGTVAGGLGLTVIERFGKRPIYLLGLPAGADADAVLADLRANPGVRFAEANVESETPEARRSNLWAIGQDTNEATYTVSWAPQALRLEQAQASGTGAGVRVAILDTGFDLTHPKLAGRLARDANGNLLGHDFVDDDGDPSDASRSTDPGYGHGTHVAGIVALSAPDATLMPVRVLDTQAKGNAWVLAEALMWAVNPDGDPTTDDGAHVINLSLGTTEVTDVLRRAVDLASCDYLDDDPDLEDEGYDDDKDRCTSGFGATVLAAAGNGASETEMMFPAAEETPGSVAVTASAETGALATFANRGDWIRLAAPGERIVSTFPGGRYAAWSGTSMATPWAAGVAALLLNTPGPDNDPELTPLRRWSAVNVAKRLLDRSVEICDVKARHLDAFAVVTDTDPPRPECP